MKLAKGDSMQKIATCLWFNGQAEEAANFYTGVFRNSRIVEVLRHGDAGPGPKGSVLLVSFELDGVEFLALNGGSAFTFSPATSHFVKCETQAEVDAYWEKLLEGGAPMECGWLTDRFGVSWQIVPTALPRMLHDADPVKSARVMRAMMTMVKLDIAGLERAYNGD
jgi:predicted 3-demethylubiquinone-9 3-methyltransferase (glyoxalase superfamily)